MARRVHAGESAVTVAAKTGFAVSTVQATYRWAKREQLLDQGAEGGHEAMTTADVYGRYGQDLTVRELREALEGLDEDLLVRLAHQPTWPFEYRIEAVAVCGPVPPAASHEQPSHTADRYCSQRCRQAAYRARLRSRPQHPAQG